MVFIVNLRKILSAYCAYSAGNESCPQPQTSEHLAAIEIMKLKHIIIMQNKIDLVKESQAKDQHDQIVKFVQGVSTFFRCYESFIFTVPFLPNREYET